jgi:hypothetical protein
MKSYEIINELKCWQGYHRVKGRPAGSPGSCAKNTNEEQEETIQKPQQEEPKQQDDNRSNMRGLMDLITTVGRAATSMKGRDLGADLKADVKTMIRNKVTGEPNR